MKTVISALRLSHRDVSYSERSENDRVLVRVGVRAGDELMLGWLRVSQDRSGVSQDDVLRR